MLKAVRRGLIVFVLILSSVAVLSGQPIDPTGDPDAVPISGLGLLLGAGAIIGVKRLLEKKKV